MDIFLTLANHLIPVIITTLVIAAIILYRVGRPYLHHIALVVAADNEEGEHNLAKHLAYKTGGKRIHVEQTWEEFIPAAQGLHKVHLQKKIDLDNKPQ